MLFKDRTQCLQEIPIGQNFEQFLGEEYMKVMKSLRKCEENTSGLCCCNFKKSKHIIRLSFHLYVFYPFFDRTGEVLHFPPMPE